MNESEVKAALAPSAPYYVNQGSDSPDLHYLVAESEAESFAFTFIDGRVAAFSLMHILPPGQQPFLPPGQEPTVSTLRNLVIKQTWTPAEIKKGDTVWLSDATGAFLSDALQCAPKLGKGWLPFGPIPDSKAGDPPAKSMVGLMKPALVSYSSSCGVSVHLNEAPAVSENDRVTSGQIQVLNFNAMNAFVAKHQQR
jgi:hypothetical protein